MNEFMIGGYGAYNESGEREFFIPGFGLILDEYAGAVSTNVVLNII